MKNIDYLAPELSNAMKKGLLSFVILCLWCACTPYNSNKTNKDLLQGEWLMIDTYYISSDSTIISEYIPTDSILLRFDAGQYTEYLSGDHKEINLRFNVSEFRIMFYKDSSIYDWTNIDILTADSLVLSKANRIWQYRKIK